MVPSTRNSTPHLGPHGRASRGVPLTVCRCASHDVPLTAVPLIGVPLTGVHLIYHTGIELKGMEFRAKRYREVS
jgi:hypothetical protein